MANRDDVGAILGLHHVKIPVSDLRVSREWYERVFELETLTEFRDDDFWAQRLESLGVDHAPIIEAAIGYILPFDDPDGLQLRFYTLDARGADLEGRIRTDLP